MQAKPTYTPRAIALLIFASLSQARRANRRLATAGAGGNRVAYRRQPKKIQSVMQEAFQAAPERFSGVGAKALR